MLVTQRLIRPSVWSATAVRLAARSSSTQAVALPNDPGHKVVSTAELLQSIAFFGLISSKSLTNLVLTLNNSRIGRAMLYPAFKLIALPKFTGGTSFESCKTIARDFYQHFGITCLIDASGEDYPSEEAFDSALQEKKRLLQRTYDELKDCVRFVPIKVTALLPAGELEALAAQVLALPEAEGEKLYHDYKANLSLLSTHPGLTRGLARLREIAVLAQKCNLSLLLDAEETTRQPAIDVLFRILVKEFNAFPSSSSGPLTPPTIYQTFQTYLVRTEREVHKNWEYCRRENIRFAVKLVRGAYMVTEREREKKQGQPLIHPSKEVVDGVYDRLAKALVQEIVQSARSGTTTHRPALLLATHNRLSLQTALNYVPAEASAALGSDLCTAQIVGMCDVMTRTLGHSISAVTNKPPPFLRNTLLLYGTYDDLFPFLVRRWIENQDGLGAVQQEMALYRHWLRQRVTGARA